MSDRYWTGSRSLGSSAKSCLDKQRITTLGLNVDTKNSPGNLSSSSSITERLSEKYCVTSFCRSAGEPALGSEAAKTSVIVFFF